MASRCPQRLSFMASISLLTSRSVRCSRDRYSALGLRPGNLAGANCIVNFRCPELPQSGAQWRPFPSLQASQLCI